ncbi:MAG: glutathione synthase/RimK-type ligase-like ATP-grasp enzyme, partial [Oleiphilaceae bacterium]
SGRQLCLSDIGAVWTRKNADFSFNDDLVNVQELKYAVMETEHTLYSMMFALDCYWMNHPSAVRSSSWKGEQLIRAAKMGLNIPESIITNQPNQAKQFISHAQGQVIFKSLSSASLGSESIEDEDDVVVTGLKTTLVTDEHLANIDAISEIPVCFQTYIEKQFELRVTVIDDEVFCAKINSQTDVRTQIDYRDYSADIIYEKYELPDNIADKVIRFVHSYGLKYGAIDLIASQNNDYFFLENNPVGQFMFIEQLVPELKMFEKIANCLIGATQ